MCQSFLFQFDKNRLSSVYLKVFGWIKYFLVSIFLQEFFTSFTFKLKKSITGLLAYLVIYMEGEFSPLKVILFMEKTGCYRNEISNNYYYTSLYIGKDSVSYSLSFQTKIILNNFLALFKTLVKLMSPKTFLYKGEILILFLKKSNH